MKITQIEEAFLKSIREVIDATPVCEKCGYDADDCGCAMIEDEEIPPIKDLSGDKEEIIINPEISMFSSARQHTMDEWTKAASR